jgi:thiamine-phosphate diphosphorylase/hydroxyethylthiazole kinase
MVPQYTTVRTVCIGGINATNLQRVLYQASYPQKPLDGVAIVSAIIAADDPKTAAQNLKNLIGSLPPFVNGRPSKSAASIQSIVEAVPSIVKSVGEKNPLSHNMTNMVVQNFAANVALAIGASPIMSKYGEEAFDLAKLGGSLVINMGTLTPEAVENYLLALRAYNMEGGPVILDPVGAGATTIRMSAVKSLMAGGYFDLIKGNENEIKTVFGQAGAQQRGVDSGVSTLTGIGKATLVRDLATRERNIVLMTGAIDYISDGVQTFSIHNGHEYLGQITGSGCVLGTIISAMLAVHREDKFLAAIAGLLLYEIAAEYASDREDVQGPGTFVPALIDELARLRDDTKKGDISWLSRANVQLE